MPEEHDVRESLQRLESFVREYLVGGYSGTRLSHRIFFYRNEVFPGVVDGIRPFERMEAGRYGFPAMTAAHDVHVGHGNHHLKSHGDSATAKRIKRRYFIALRPFVQAVGVNF